MKSPTAYYLLLLYATIMFKPLIPALSDAWEHAFHEMEHKSLVHATFGSQHLQQEMAESNAASDNGKCSNSLKPGDEVPFHVPVNGYANNQAPKIFIPLSDYLKPVKLSAVFISREGPPPKAT